MQNTTHNTAFQFDLGAFLNQEKMKTNSPITDVDYNNYIGHRVSKLNKHKDVEPKPFKSGCKVNTVKSIIIHPILNIPAFTFYEDNSYVECRRCEIVD